ncbi:hypothetical protein AHAS_Ahas19G0207200 [Arachis hypogaea]
MLSAKEEVEIFEPMISYPQRLIEVVEEHENFPPKDLMENHEEEKEEVNQEISHSREVESCIEEWLIEPPIQEAFDEENTPTITQQPCLDIQEVKATNNNNEERIVTKLQLIISRKKKRSTTSNPTPKPPASKFNQANNKRDLADRRPRKGALTGSSLPLRSFLLTNWKKRKKF